MMMFKKANIYKKEPEMREVDGKNEYLNKGKGI